MKQTLNKILKHNQVQCVFLFPFLYSKEKKQKEKHFFHKIFSIIKINTAKCMFDACAQLYPPPPIINRGGSGKGQDLPKIESLGSVPKFCQKRGITLKRGIDVEMGGWGGGGLSPFYYFTVQLHLLCVLGKTKVSFITIWFFSPLS